MLVRRALVTALCLALALAPGAALASPPGVDTSIQDTQLTEAAGLAMRGRLADAEALFVQVLKNSPACAGALLGLGNLAVVRGDLPLGLSYYDEALRHSPSDPGAHANRAYALWLLGDRKSAQREAQRVIELTGGLDRALALLGLAGADGSVKEAEGGALTRAGARRMFESASTAAEPPVPSGGETHNTRLDDVAPVLYWNAAGTAAGAPALAVTVERYPALDAPETVITDEPFAVEVSLNEERSDPVTVTAGDTTAAGKLALTLPAGDAWAIDVVLSAPGFDFVDGINTQTMQLRRKGNSSPALFKLRRRPVPAATRRTLRANLYHRGAFVAQLTRTITVGTQPGGQPAAPRAVAAAAPQLEFSPGLAVPDLTLCVGIPDAAHPEKAEATLTSPHWPWPRVESFSIPEDFRAWLESQYAAVSHRAVRGVVAPQKPATDDANDRARFRGFGRELCRRFSPASFREAIWELHDQLGPRFESIQICSDDPSIPWELMIPTRAAGTPPELDFLGLEFRIGRWHLDPTRTGFRGRPPQIIALREVVAMAPEYTGTRALQHQSEEIAPLTRLPGYRFLGGTAPNLSRLITRLPQGIFHFAGHGDMQAAGGNAVEYSLILEDAPLDLMAWRGLTPAKPTTHPLVFLNACDLGRSNRIANFVDGWAPAVLDAGAGGYIGGLWPLPDQGASEFAQRFYSLLGDDLKSGRAEVADVLLRARRRYQSTGDTTCLAYVYYGDPMLTLVTGP